MVPYGFVDIILKKGDLCMKTYQKPQIVLQSIDVADVLTASPILFVDDADTKGNAVTINWANI